MRLGLAASVLLAAETRQGACFPTKSDVKRLFLILGQEGFQDGSTEPSFAVVTLLHAGHVCIVPTVGEAPAGWQRCPCHQPALARAAGHLAGDLQSAFSSSKSLKINKRC